ncbi:hypothetical protein [Rosistilla oblonga]|uniref:hypothetical protein n=1 Tax=Rosistilla oblonga TaxID=2527990 RepID=UPI003A9725A6
MNRQFAARPSNDRAVEVRIVVVRSGIETEKWKEPAAQNAAPLYKRSRLPTQLQLFPGQGNSVLYRKNVAASKTDSFG